MSTKLVNDFPAPCTPGIVGLAPRPIDLLPLLRDGILTGLWSCEAADPEWERRFGVETFSLEDISAERARWRSCDLDALLPYAGRLRRAPDAVTMVGYSLSSAWRGQFPSRRRSGAVPSALADKTVARRWLRGLGVPVPSSISVSAAALDYPRLAHRVGRRFIIQTPIGSGGAGTFLVRCEADTTEAKVRHPDVGRWLASAYAGPITVNLHGLISPQGDVMVTAPSVQLAGLPQAGAGFGEYAGSDFSLPSALPPRVLRTCRSFTARIGRSLSGLGHRGIFGVDYAVDDTTVTALEVNARIQASTWLLGELEREAGQVPTLCRHVIPTQNQHRPAHGAAPTGTGTQLVVRHTGPAWRLTRPPQPGVYVLDREQLRRIRAGTGLVDCGPGEITVNSLPLPGTLILPGAAIGRLATRASLTTTEGNALTPSGAALLGAFRSLFTSASRALATTLKET